jgi:hypothetical protein
MPLPNTRDELEKLGYRFENESRCRACGIPVVWYSTPNRNPETSKLNRICFEIRKNAEDNMILIAHFPSCPNAADFRKKGGRFGKK